ncbi:MAG: protein kinase [Verrucomicrobiota bacterium]
MKPTLPGYQIGDFIGRGVFGEVWAGEDPVGNEVAVRVLDAGVCQVDYLRASLERLEGYEGQGHGPVPVWLKVFNLKRPLLVTPLLGSWIEGRFLPSCLQARLGEYLGRETAEPLVKCLASALAVLHRNQVVHGHLKPGNVYITEEGRVQVGDYGCGWKSGKAMSGFSDAVLYMPPEQLRNARGLMKEEGYRWDVYAFGVLAYRLLEGRFPRCGEEFEGVAPVPGVLAKEGVEANLRAVADLLEAEGEVTWTGEVSPVLRSIVERCLAIDPRERFRDMVELCEVWERELVTVRYHVDMEVMSGHLKRGEAVKRLMVWGAAASVVLSASLTAIWKMREHSLEGQVKMAESSAKLSKGLEVMAVTERNRVQGDNETLVAALALATNEIEHLSASRTELLDWALEEGGAVVPRVTSREERLERLDGIYAGLLDGEGAEGNEVFRRQWLKERAMLAVAQGKTREARALLRGEVSDLGARGLTELLYLESEQRSASTAEMEMARNLVKREGGGLEGWLMVALDLVEARGWEREGKGDQALRKYGGLFPQLEELRAADPGVISLVQSEVRLEAAMVAEGAGRDDVGDVFRERVVRELASLLEEESVPEELRMRFREEYVVAAVGLAERAYGAGDLQSAEEIAKAALAQVDEPPHEDVRTAVAVLQAVLAGCEREMGQTEKAEEQLSAALRLIEEKQGDERLEQWRRYREAMLKWQMAGVQGQLGNEQGEVEYGREALYLLRGLLDGASVRPTAIQVHRVMGYLCSDLARASEALGVEEEEPLVLLDEAIESWKFLREADPEETEYHRGLEWCESQREDY